MQRSSGPEVSQALSLPLDYFYSNCCFGLVCKGKSKMDKTCCLKHSGYDIKNERWRHTPVIPARKG